MNSTPSWLLIFVLLVGALAVGAPVRADAPQIWQRSYDLEARGEHAASLAALNKLPEEAKTDYLFLVRRAWLLYLTARYQEAVGAYRQAIEAHSLRSTASRMRKPRRGPRSDSTRTTTP
jgi:tetratricopeptide (TPR) repeat protein